jgi:hypothetical protein
MIVSSPVLAQPKRNPRPLVVLIVAIVAATALRVWIAWWLGYLNDIQAFQFWAMDPGEFGLKSGSLKWPYQNYPPLYCSILRLLRWTHRALQLPGDFTQAVYLLEDVSPSRPIILLLKTPSIVADAWCGALI